MDFNLVNKLSLEKVKILLKMKKKLKNPDESTLKEIKMLRKRIKALKKGSVEENKEEATEQKKERKERRSRKVEMFDKKKMLEKEKEQKKLRRRMEKEQKRIDDKSKLRRDIKVTVESVIDESRNLLIEKLEQAFQKELETLKKEKLFYKCEYCEVPLNEMNKNKRKELGDAGWQFCWVNDFIKDKTTFVFQRIRRGKDEAHKK